MTAMVLVWILMGLLVGFSSSCLYKMFKGSEWKEITFQTAFLCREPLLLGSLQIWMKSVVLTGYSSLCGSPRWSLGQR
jgi:hypothetical protein